MEVNLARVKHERPEAQILALSATVGNADQIAKWLGAKRIQSDWRPVVLRYGTVCDGLVERRLQVGPDEEKIQLPPPFELPEAGEELRNVLLSTIQDSGQILIFRGTRRYAEGSATKLGKWMFKSASRRPGRNPSRSDGLTTTRVTPRKRTTDPDL